MPGHVHMAEQSKTNEENVTLLLESEERLPSNDPSETEAFIRKLTSFFDRNKAMGSKHSKDLHL